MTTVTDTATQAPYAEPHPAAAPLAESRGFSIASLVLGLVSIVRAAGSRLSAMMPSTRPAIGTTKL